MAVALYWNTQRCKKKISTLEFGCARESFAPLAIPQGYYVRHWSGINLLTFTLILNNTTQSPTSGGDDDEFNVSMA
jgi:hypothetical protein